MSNSSINNIDLHDDEIRVLGSPAPSSSRGKGTLVRLFGGVTHRPRRAIVLIITILAILSLVTYCVVLYVDGSRPVEPPHDEIGEYEHDDVLFARPQPTSDELSPLGSVVDSSANAFTEIIDTTLNDVSLRIYIPHNATMQLHIGKIDTTDASIIYAAQAADVREDNGEIVGAFVLGGEPRAWGLSKKGYCAQIDGRVYVGVADNSPLFEEATEKGGYFFRHFPLVDDGSLVEVNIKGKAIRRAVCLRAGQVFTIETMAKESYHDFSEALVDLGVANAVALVGGSAYGWAVERDGTISRFGSPITPKHIKPMHQVNVNYIIWRK